MDIILYLLSVIQYLYQQNCWLISFICRYIPLKQWAFDDSHSPKYQKFKVDVLPKVQIIQHEWNWQLLIPYLEHRYLIKIKPVSRRKECDIPIPVALHSLIFTAIMAKPGSSNAKSAIQTSPRMRTALQSSLPCTAPTVGKHSWQKKSGNTLFSINVSTRNVLTISTI